MNKKKKKPLLYVNNWETLIKQKEREREYYLVPEENQTVIYIGKKQK